MTLYIIPSADDDSVVECDFLLAVSQPGDMAGSLDAVGAPQEGLLGQEG